MKKLFAVFAVVALLSGCTVIMTDYAGGVNYTPLNWYDCHNYYPHYTPWYWYGLYRQYDYFYYQYPRYYINQYKSTYRSDAKRTVTKRQITAPKSTRTTVRAVKTVRGTVRSTVTKQDSGVTRKTSRATSTKRVKK